MSNPFEISTFRDAVEYDLQEILEDGTYILYLGTQDEVDHVFKVVPSAYSCYVTYVTVPWVEEKDTEYEEEAEEHIQWEKMFSDFDLFLAEIHKLKEDLTAASMADTSAVDEDGETHERRPDASYLQPGGYKVTVRQVNPVISKSDEEMMEEALQDMAEDFVEKHSSDEDSSEFEA